MFISVGVFGLFGLLWSGCLYAQANSATTYPVVVWSFDKYNNTRLLPDYLAEDGFYGDISSNDQNISDFLRPGIEAHCVFLPGKVLYLARSLTPADCLVDVEKCLGITIAFWVKVVTWGDGSGQSIMKTMDDSRTSPGIFFGKGDGDQFLVYIRGSDGKTYETSFRQSQALNRWAHFNITWSKFNQEITVNINGTSANKETRIGDAITKPNAEANLVLGNTGGPTFFIDELKVYYMENRTYELSTTQYIPGTTAAAPTIGRTTTAPTVGTTATAPTIVTTAKAVTDSTTSHAARLNFCSTGIIFLLILRSFYRPCM